MTRGINNGVMTRAGNYAVNNGAMTRAINSGAMSRARTTPMAVLVVAFLGGVMPAWAVDGMPSPSPSLSATAAETGSLLDASERLAGSGTEALALGWWSRGTFITREALPQEFESVLAAGWEPRRGVGAAVFWRRFWSESPSQSLCGQVVVRRESIRAGAGLCFTHRGPRNRLGIPLRLQVRVLPFLLVDVHPQLFPGEKNLAPKVALAGVLVHGPWMASLEAGPGGSTRTGIGLAFAPGFVWTAGYEQEGVSFGLAWRVLGLEFRAHELQHPTLGAVTRLGVVLGGGPQRGGALLNVAPPGGAPLSSAPPNSALLNGAPPGGAPLSSAPPNSTLLNVAPPRGSGSDLQ